MIKRLISFLLFVLLMLSLILAVAADIQGTCKNPNGGNYCGDKSLASDCYCDKDCTRIGDCCDDYQQVCLNINPQQCNDTDNGKNYFIKGTTTAQGVSRTDFCYSSSQLHEYYCDPSAQVAFVLTTCPTSCSIGACLNQIKKNDVLDYLGKSTSTSTAATKEQSISYVNDKCTDTTTSGNCTPPICNPPTGCHYENGSTCSCGKLVCGTKPPQNETPPAPNGTIQLIQVKLTKGSGNPRTLFVNGKGFDESNPRENKITFDSIILAPPISVRTLTEDLPYDAYYLYEPTTFKKGTQLFSVNLPENRLVPGTYSVYISNKNGISNNVPVTITSNMIPPNPNEQVGNIQIRRVGSDSTPATAPTSMAAIDLDPSADSANPARYVNIPIGSHAADVTDIDGYTERAGTCTYAIGTTECNVASFTLIPYCGIDSSMPTVPGGRTALFQPNPFLGSKLCTIFAPVSRGFETKVVFQYTPGIIPPPQPTGNMKILATAFSIGSPGVQHNCEGDKCGYDLYINGKGFATGSSVNIVNFGNTQLNSISVVNVDNTDSPYYRYAKFPVGSQVLTTRIPDDKFIAGVYDVFVTNAVDTSNTVQVIISQDMVPAPPSPGPIPDPSTVPLKIQYPNGVLPFQSPGYLNGENLILVEGSRITKGVVFDLFKSDGVTQTGTVSAQPTDFSLDQTCGPLEKYESHLWCRTAFWLTLGNNPAAAGSYFVRARNPDGATSNLLPFEIVGGSQLITKVLVDGTIGYSAIQGKSNILDVLGANFVSGGTVTIRNAICGIVFCSDEAGNSNPVTLPYEFVSTGHLKVKWTPPIYNPTPDSVSTDPRGYNIQINNPDGTKSANIGNVPNAVPSLPWQQPPGLQYSLSPIKGKVGTTFSFCTNNPITNTNLIVTAQNGIQMIVAAQRGGNCPSGQNGVTFTMSPTINAIPGFADFYQNDPWHPQSFNVVPGFYQFGTKFDKSNSYTIHYSGNPGQTWTVEISS